MQRNRKLDIAQRARFGRQTGMFISHQKRGRLLWIQIMNLRRHPRNRRCQPETTLAQRRKRRRRAVVFHHVEPFVAALGHFVRYAEALTRGNDVDFRHPHGFAAPQDRAAVVGIMQVFEHHDDTRQPSCGHFVDSCGALFVDERTQKFNNRGRLGKRQILRPMRGRPQVREFCNRFGTSPNL